MMAKWVASMLALNALVVGSWHNAMAQTRDAQRVIPVAHVPLAATPDAEVRSRLSQFVVELGSEIVTLATLDTVAQDQYQYIDVPPPGRSSRSPLEVVRIWKLGQPADIVAGPVGGVGLSISRMPTAQWLDSLRMLWPATHTDARTQWLFGWNAVDRLLAPALVRLGESATRDSAIQEALLGFVHQLQQAAARIPRYDHAEGLGAAASAIRASVQEARGDTVAAIQSWLEVARFPRTFLARALAQEHAIDYAVARHDTVAWFAALTFRKLETRWGIPQDLEANAARLRADDEQLAALYRAYTSTRGSMPDVVPTRLTSNPLPNGLLSLDAYLDRQWIGLYDRNFPIVRAKPPTIHPSRLVIVEYTSWPGCSGCWDEDRGLQPLTRRYSADQVLPLSYPWDEPTGCQTDSTVQRFFAWYPSRYPVTSNLGFRGLSARIPVRTLVTAQGDTLSGAFFVNGRSVPNDPRSVFPPDGFSKYNRAVAAIDSELTRWPTASMRLQVHTDSDKVTATVHLDSIQKSHRNLAIRIVLFEDTVWIHTGTIRRIYQNVVRGVAQNDTLSLGLPFPHALPATISYTFDVGRMEQRLRAALDPMARRRSGESEEDAEFASRWYRLSYSDPRDWTIRRSRLHVVAFVQDVETGEILQAVRKSLMP